MHQAEFEKTFESWRKQAREFLEAGVLPDEINWNNDAPTLFSFEPSSAPPLIKHAAFFVPADFLRLAEMVSFARAEDRWDLLYRILFRLQKCAHLLKISVDPDVRRSELLANSVRRDIHKLHAFVRFKKTLVEDAEMYVAWHKSEHLVLKPGAPFFARRFGDRRWSIFTPDESAHWDLKTLTFGQGMQQSDFAARDQWDEVWKTYYKSIFNPARIKIKAMKLEMAPKYWAALPEATVIHDLLRDAPRRLQVMSENHNQAAEVGAHKNLDELRSLAARCTSCPLYERATQTVFGAGSSQAPIMIVGEQPGDQEDQRGEPFIGPAGQLLRQALAEAGMTQDQIYFTNAVKHFKWMQGGDAGRGKFRLHKKPSGREMHACKPWLEAEIALVKPRVIIALGATAATAVIGKLPRLADERGVILTHLKVAPSVVLSWHPSAILRAPAGEAPLLREQLVADLRLGLLELDVAVRAT